MGADKRNHKSDHYIANRNVCCSIASFTAVYGVSSIFTTTCMSYIASQITTLEKYFGFNSSQTGFLLACNDIGFLMATLVISHLANRVHIPRALAITTMLFGIAAIVCSMSYFASLTVINIQTSFTDEESNKTIQFEDNNVHLCDIFGNTSSLNCSIESHEESVEDKQLMTNLQVGIPTPFTSIALVILDIGMIVQGIARSPRTAFLTVYIEDNGERSKSALYFGIFVFSHASCSIVLLQTVD